MRDRGRWDQATEVVIRGKRQLKSIQPPLSEAEIDALEANGINPETELQNPHGTTTALGALAICGSMFRGGAPQELADILKTSIK